MIFIELDRDLKVNCCLDDYNILWAEASLDHVMDTYANYDANNDEKD